MSERSARTGEHRIQGHSTGAGGLPGPLLEISGLRVGFDTEDGEVQAVRDISLRLERGEILALCGESGCG